MASRLLPKRGSLGFVTRRQTLIDSSPPSLSFCSRQQVLHMDRNNYYGGESASLNLNQVRPLFRHARRRRARALVGLPRARDACGGQEARNGLYRLWAER